MREMTTNTIYVNDNEPTWAEQVKDKKFYAGSSMNLYVKNIKKAIPDIISTHVFHTNHIRPMLRYVIKKFGEEEIVGCEVGVADGKHSFNMLYHLNTLRVYMVDPWINYETAYNECKERVKQFGDRAVIIRKMSHEAINDIKDELNFVYLDANHKYDFVKRDIELYYPLVKSGGVFGGHDFSPCTPNVARAVLELVDREGLKIHGQSSDWWVIKSGDKVK